MQLPYQYSSSSVHPLTPSHREEVRALCIECFPISYPDSWYNYITSNKVYSLGSFTSDGSLMGILVAELQSLGDLEGELGPLLHKPCPHSTVMYILSLGVRSQYRRQGIGRHLMGQLFRHVASLPSCQLVYLHVLATNSQALGFYNNVGFTQLQIIPDYYYISFRHAAAVVCCHYVNGGQPFPHTFSSYCQRYILNSWCCRILSELGQWLVKLARGEDLEQPVNISH